MNLITLLLTHNTIFILLSSKKKIHLFLGAFATLRKETISYRMSVRRRGTTRLPLDGLS